MLSVNESIIWAELPIFSEIEFDLFYKLVINDYTVCVHLFIFELSII